MVNCYTHYAQIEDGTFIKASEVVKSQRHLHKFRCPSCGEEMNVRLGEKRIKHFAHKPNSNKKCTYESYLHALAKKQICRWFNSQDDIPLIIKTPTKCSVADTCKWFDCSLCERTVDNNINLKKLFSCCEVEKEYDKGGKTYRADILCYNKKKDGTPLFIEINVKHPCETEKTSSGIKIIEVKIESEEDIEEFISNPIMRSRKVEFYNFTPKVQFDNNIKIDIVKYKLCSNGLCLPEVATCKDYAINRTGDIEVSVRLNDVESSDINVFGKMLAYKIRNVVSSELCKWKGLEYSKNIFHCNCLKILGADRSCYDRKASGCPYFEPNVRYNSIINLIHQLEENGKIEIWQQGI